MLARTRGPTRGAPQGVGGRRLRDSLPAALLLCRPYYAIPFALTYLLTVYYARGGLMAGQWPGALLSAAALALLVAFAYVMNDVCDVAVDRLNAPRRPIASGRVRRRAAAVFAAVLLGGAMALAGACRWQFLAVLAALAAGLIGYNLFSKRLGAFKQLCVAVLATGIYPLALAQAGGARGSRAGSLAVFPIWWFLTAVGYELLKDLRDAKGDRIAAAGALPLHRRARLWRRVSAGAIWAAALMLVGPALLGCRWVYMAIAAAAMAAALAAGLLPTRRAIAAVYVECWLVGAAATLDVLIFGF